MARKYGTDVTSTDLAANAAPTPLTLNGSSQSLVPANAGRIELFITSPAAAITIVLGSAAAVANQGIVIPPATLFRLKGYTGAVQIIGTAAQVVSWAEL